MNTVKLRFEEGKVVDWDMVESNWQHFSGRVKGRWSRLTDDNLETITGNRQQLVSILQNVYAITAEIAEQQVSEFELRNQDYRPSTSSTSKWRSVSSKFAE